MCEHGDTIDVPVMVLSAMAHGGQDEVKVKPIDRCIAPIVKALNDGGVYMLGSCCGHGMKMGEIALADGRYLHVQQNPGV